MNNLRDAQKKLRYKNELAKVKVEAKYHIPLDLFRKYFDQLEHQNWICYYCNLPFTDAHRPNVEFDELDNIIRISC